MKYDGAAVRQWVAGVLAGIYEPELDEEPWQWAERTLEIPWTENEEMAGKLWDSSLTPYVREIMEWARRPGKGEFWIRKSSQVGLTMAMLVLICWMIVNRPGNVGYAIDSVTEARNISKVRLQKWITENALLEEMGEETDSLSNLTYYLRRMTVYLMGAYSPGAWANKSIVLFLLDELDKHPYIEGEGTTVTLARERCKRPKNAKIVGWSSPGETGQITKEEKRGTQERPFLMFPCGHEQPLKFENLVFGTKEFRDLADAYDLEVVQQKAYFRCEIELCTCRLDDAGKRAALRKGCRLVATNPKPVPGVRSLEVWDGYSPFVTIGQIAVEWIQAQGDMELLERFYRGRLGRNFEKSGRALKHEDIIKARMAYVRGECPFVPVLLCQAIDIQGDVQKAVKVAVDEKGNFWVIDWFVSLVLREAVEWGYEPVKGPDGKDLYISAGFIDEGHRTDEVRRMCLEFMPVFWPVKGRGKMQVQNTISTSPKWVDGQTILTYHISEDDFKWQMLKMITERDKRLKKLEPVMHFPHDAEDDDDFVAEMCNERPVMKKNALGREKWEWEKLGPNDFWDCVKYCVALYAAMRPALVETPVPGRRYELKKG